VKARWTGYNVFKPLEAGLMITPATSSKHTNSNIHLRSRKLRSMTKQRDISTPQTKRSISGISMTGEMVSVDPGRSAKLANVVAKVLTFVSLPEFQAADGASERVFIDQLSETRIDPRVRFM
jgi:ribosomal protein L2